MNNFASFSRGLMLKNIAHKSQNLAHIESFWHKSEFTVANLTQIKHVFDKRLQEIELAHHHACIFVDSLNVGSFLKNFYHLR